MKKSQAESIIRELLQPAGVCINGDHPWDIQVHRRAFYDRVLAYGSLGLGESYMDQWWECEALDQFFYRILRYRLDRQIQKPHIRALMASIKARVFNAQSRHKAFEVGEHHYDIGNRLFSLMLDKRMNYSCGYWRDADCLDNAQESKLDLICKKLRLEPGQHVLDIGCGWGAFARFAAEVYKVSVTGITISRRQVAYCQKRTGNGNQVCIMLKDYRDLDEQFDRIVSVGMFEHVGVQNYRTFINTVRKCLKKEGLFLLQTIGANTSSTRTDPWIEKYIFPNGMLPSPRQIMSAAEGQLVLEDWHSIGHDYDRTLMAWYHNFTANWHRIKADYDQRFYRMWTYYLLACAGAFRARRNQLWQIVFSRAGLKDGYRTVV